MVAWESVLWKLDAWKSTTYYQGRRTSTTSNGPGNLLYADMRTVSVVKGSSSSPPSLTRLGYFVSQVDRMSTVKDWTSCGEGVNGVEHGVRVVWADGVTDAERLQSGR
jgi:hypothetical protein